MAAAAAPPAGLLQRLAEHAATRRAVAPSAPPPEPPAHAPSWDFGGGRNPNPIPNPKFTLPSAQPGRPRAAGSLRSHQLAGTLRGDGGSSPGGTLRGAPGMAAVAEGRVGGEQAEPSAGAPAAGGPAGTGTLRAGGAGVASAPLGRSRLQHLVRKTALSLCQGCMGLWQGTRAREAVHEPRLAGMVLRWRARPALLPGTQTQQLQTW